ncbi:hypothetical protein Hsw_PA0185 (plasmid) [Hymenobacter swuensis DY53]|uniref:Uncharacterized protein n=1 Tax=Hymenobacter swuensis DY53 TaxID=1227739 RepID=W8ESL6_9BACT|nr:hypothetical protein Hsw_PA0185 [Hymenobacter swuensis DY53]
MMAAAVGLYYSGFLSISGYRRWPADGIFEWVLAALRLGHDEMLGLGT